MALGTRNIRMCFAFASLALLIIVALFYLNTAFKSLAPEISGGKHELSGRETRSPGIFIGETRSDRAGHAEKRDGEGLRRTGLANVDARWAQGREVLFPAPSFFQSANSPFVFDPMLPFSAPMTALQQLKVRINWSPPEDSLLRSPALYSVDHSCTLVFPHSGVKSEEHLHTRTPRIPFVQSFQLLEPDVFVESSGLTGMSYVRESNLLTGVTKRLFTLPKSDFAEGVAVLYSVSMKRLLLLVLTWNNRRVFVVDHETFECIGSLSVELEGWGFVSNLDLGLWYRLKQAAAAASTAASAAEENASSRQTSGYSVNASVTTNVAILEMARESLQKQFLRSVRSQRLWLTTGGPELIEVNVPHLLSQIEKNAFRGPMSGHTAFSQARCFEHLGALLIRRTAVVHCLGRVVVGLNELEFSHSTGELFANLYGMPALIGFDPSTGACTKLVSLSGVTIVEKHHDRHHRVANGIAFPLETDGKIREEMAISMLITGKEWPAIAKVRLRRLREGDLLTVERNDTAGQCDAATYELPSAAQWAKVGSLEELTMLYPYFFKLHGNG